MIAIEVILMWINIGIETSCIEGVDSARGCILRNTTHGLGSAPTYQAAIRGIELSFLVLPSLPHRSLAPSLGRRALQVMMILTVALLTWRLRDRMRASPPTDVLALASFEIVVGASVLTNVISVGFGATDSIGFGFAFSEVRMSHTYIVPVHPPSPTPMQIACV